MNEVTKRTLIISMFSIFIGLFIQRITEGITDPILFMLTVIAILVDIFGVWINYRALYEKIEERI